LASDRSVSVHQILGLVINPDTKTQNIFVHRFSILRPKKCLAGPRVAALQHPDACDEWNHNSDESKGKFTIYPLASEID
jgi:hypothetical protein